MTKSELRKLIAKRYYTFGEELYKMNGGKQLPILNIISEEKEKLRLYNLSEVAYYLNLTNDNNVRSVVFYSIEINIKDLSNIINFMCDDTKIKISIAKYFIDYCIATAIYRLLSFESINIVSGKFTEHETDSILDEKIKEVSEWNIHDMAMEYLYKEYEDIRNQFILELIDQTALKPISAQEVYNGVIVGFDKYTESVLQSIKSEIYTDNDKYELLRDGVYLNKLTKNIKLNPLI